MTSKYINTSHTSETNTTMEEWREQQRHNLLAQKTARLITDWTLDPLHVATLETYYISDFLPHVLDRLLLDCNGLFKMQGRIYIPVFSNCLRKDIREGKYEHYIVSFRKERDTAFGYAIVQPKLFGLDEEVSNE